MIHHRTAFAMRMLTLFVVALLIGGIVVMLLWNWLMPAIFGLGPIGYLQALGLLVLARILVGWRRGGHWGAHWIGHWGGRRWRARMQERWANMSDEEREKFRSMMQRHCGHGHRHAHEFPEGHGHAEHAHDRETRDGESA